MSSRIEHGSIDWLCWRRFAACFSALLGDTNHGHWSIAPAVVGSDIKISRRCANSTLILETEFTSADVRKRSSSLT
jgi:GH15 family glucan-1,4-alpha-glucosidase